MWLSRSGLGLDLWWLRVLGCLLQVNLQISAVLLQQPLTRVVLQLLLFVQELAMVMQFKMSSMPGEMLSSTFRAL